MKTSIKLSKARRAKADGTVALYLYVYIDGQKEELPLNLAWPLNYISEKNNELLPREKVDKICDDYNLIIRAEIGKVNEILTTYRLSNKILALSDLKREYFEYERRKDFLVFFENEIRDRVRRKKIKSSTSKGHVAALNWLKLFKGKISYIELTKKFIQDFEHWLSKQNNRRSKAVKKLDANTIANVLKSVKAYINLAIRDGVSIQNPFDTADVKTSQNQKMIIHFAPEQVVSVMSYYDSQKMEIGEQLTICRFLIACVLSLRISDILKIDMKQLEYLRMNMKLAFYPQKQQITKDIRTVFVPIDDSTLKYIEDVIRLSGDASSKNLVISEAYGRKVLKKVFLKLSLPHGNFHTGRHSFATNYLRAGGKVQNLQHIMGHSKIETTMRYVHIVDKDKEAEMLMLSNFYDSFKTK